MAKTENKSRLKSAGAGKPLRSRGFLSHPGGHTQSGSKDAPAPGQETRKSRGTRQAAASSDGKPKALSPKVSPKPYRLEEK